MKDIKYQLKQSMSRRIICCALVALVFVATIPEVVSTASITVCSSSGNATCASSNRVCINEGGNETCGNCASGYIDLSQYISLAGCQSINGILPWETFLSVFKPQYSNTTQGTTQERLTRLDSMMQFVSNFQSQIPPPPFSVGVNKYSADLPDDHKGLAGNKPNASAATTVGFDRFQASDRQLASLPSAIDWEARGATTYVKDQGRCGCCWSISCMGAVEGATFITDGYIQSLSFQQLISCDTQDGGCSGGNIVYAMSYAAQNSFGGLASLNDYPYMDGGAMSSISSIKDIEASLLYDGATTSACELTGKSVAVEVYSPTVVVTYTDGSSFDERVQLLKSATAQQPVSVALSSNCNVMISYTGGIITDDADCGCEDESCIDHAVLLVGYDDTSNPPYWKLKNSWGSDWGESGYFRISQEGGGNWGLFGILGEGVIALKAVNTTSAQPDDVPWDSQFPWWEILLMAVGGLLVLCVIFNILRCLCCSSTQRSKY